MSPKGMASAAAMRIAVDAKILHTRICLGIFSNEICNAFKEINRQRIVKNKSIKQI